MKGLEAIISLRNRLVEKSIKDQFLDELLAIEKEFKALEIIKKKRVDTIGILNTNCADEYNSYIDNMPLCFDYLIQEEFAILKEVLL